MVKAAGKAPGAGAIRSVKVPAPIGVEVDWKGHPAAIRTRDIRGPVVKVEDRWRIDDEWWRDRPVSRLYYRVLLEDGRHVTLFHDLIYDRWYEQDYD